MNDLLITNETKILAFQAGIEKARGVKREL